MNKNKGNFAFQKEKKSKITENMGTVTKKNIKTIIIKNMNKKQFQEGRLKSGDKREKNYNTMKKNLKKKKKKKKK